MDPGAGGRTRRHPAVYALSLGAGRNLAESEALEKLCGALRAYPAESAALADRRFSLDAWRQEDKTTVSPEMLEARLRWVKICTDTPELYPQKDLFWYSLTGQIATLARKREAAGLLLAQALTFHANHHAEHGRQREATRLAWRAIPHYPQRAAAIDPDHSRALVLACRAYVFTASGADHAAGLRRFATLFHAPLADEYRAWVLSEISYSL